MTDRLRQTIVTVGSLKRHPGLVLVLLVFFALASYNNYVMPLTTGPDEAAHFQFARFLYRERYLPLTVDERREAGYKSDQPPLNSLLVSADCRGGSVLAFWAFVVDCVQRRFAGSRLSAGFEIF